VVLQALKHQETSLVLKLFTREKGLITCYIRNGSSKKKRTVKWQLLDVVNLDLVHNNRNDFYGIKESAYAFNHSNRYFDPYKLSLTYFIAEMLLKAISERNVTYPELYEFALKSLEELDQSSNIGLFPVDFLLNMSEVLGIYPKVSPGADVFNLSEGTIDTHPHGLQSISSPEVLLLGEYISTGRFEVLPNKEQRARMLQLLLDFYKYHVPGFLEIKSLGVLKEVLN